MQTAGSVQPGKQDTGIHPYGYESRTPEMAVFGGNSLQDKKVRPTALHCRNARLGLARVQTRPSCRLHRAVQSMKCIYFFLQRFRLLDQCFQFLMHLLKILEHLLHIFILGQNFEGLIKHFFAHRTSSPFLLSAYGAVVCFASAAVPANKIGLSVK